MYNLAVLQVRKNEMGRGGSFGPPLNFGSKILSSPTYQVGCQISLAEGEDSKYALIFALGPTHEEIR